MSDDDFCPRCRRPWPDGVCDDCLETEREATGAPCRNCGTWQPDDVLEFGFCPGCVYDCLCAQCRRPCDPTGGLCDDCAEIAPPAVEAAREVEAFASYATSGRVRVARVPEFVSEPPALEAAPDGLTEAGARRHARIIEEAWARVGVQVQTRIQPMMLAGSEWSGFVVRVDLPGGLPRRL